MTQFTSSQLRVLRNAAEGVTRVTDQLIEIVKEIANVIAKLGLPGNEIMIGRERLYIDHRSSKMAGYNFLFLETDQVGDTAFDFSGGYLHDDFNCYIHGASKDQIIWFAENLGDILQGFIDLWESQKEIRTVYLGKIKKELKKIID